MSNFLVEEFFDFNYLQVATFIAVPVKIGGFLLSYSDMGNWGPEVDGPSHGDNEAGELSRSLKSSSFIGPYISAG